ncbi:hypothetical protein Tco_0394076 [Tanacetum coccineum]
MAMRTQPTLSPGMSARKAKVATLSPSSFRKRGGDDKEEAAPEGQQQAVPAEDTAVNEPLGLGYGAFRCRELVVGEGEMPSMFEVGQSSRSMPEHEGAKRMSAFRQPTLVTWVDPEDDRIYTNIPTYVPPVAHVQTPPSPEWSSSSLPVLPSSPAVPTLVASLVTTSAATIAVDEDEFLEVRVQLELHRSKLHDHTQRLDALPPTLFEGYDRDLRELYTRLWAVRDDIFSQHYRFRSLEREKERAMVTFSAIWRPVLALEAWAGQTDAYRVALWHDIYDTQRENHDLRMQIAKERHERLELTYRVARMERRQESKGE